MRDSSLDDFLSDPDEESEVEGTSASEGETVDDQETEHAEPEPDDEIESESESDTDGADESEEGPPSTAEVEPARSTYAWSPDGGPCEACGERVEERWESADGLVCIRCKEW
jgi:hypothetical protein